MRIPKYGIARYTKNILAVIEKFFVDNNFSGSWMLDMGCSAGYYSYIGRKFFQNVVAVDIDEAAVKEAAKRLSPFSNVHVQKNRIETFSSQHRFDLILCLVMVRWEYAGTRINVTTIGNMVKLLTEKGVLLVDVYAPLIPNIETRFNIVKTSETIELAHNIVKKQRRLFIRRR